MTLPAMTSFAPSLPALPSYPRPRSGPKRTRRTTPSFATDVYSSPFFAAPLTPDASDTDDGLMSQSVYSDRGYRSSLVSRKRGLSDVDRDDDGHDRDLDLDRGAGGKRRLLDVVGGTLGGVLRGAWEVLRPRIPFYNPTPTPPPVEEEPEPEEPEEEPVATFAPTAWGSQPEPWQAPWGQPQAPAWGQSQTNPWEPSQAEVWSTPQQPQQPQQTTAWGVPQPTQAWGGQQRVQAWQTQASAWSQPQWGNPQPNHWGPPAPISPPSTAGSSRSRSGYFDSASTAPLETGMSTQWIMVSPATTPSPTTTNTSNSRQLRSPSISTTRSTATHTRSLSAPIRRLRPVATKKRGLKPPGSPAVKRHRKGGSMPVVLGDDEMDEDMRRFNDKLKAMIREGKEALGATVEVVYDDDDIGMAY